MHPNPIFRKADNQQNIKCAQERSFGTLAINADDGPLLSHIPFLLSDDGTRLEAHLVRSNPVWRALDQPCKAVIAITNGDSYISPDWYGLEDQVPTWNYVAVHLHGLTSRLPDEELPGILTRLSAHFETKLLPKPLWTMDKVNDDALARMMRMIAPIAMEITAIDGTWKLAQNKPEDARLAVAGAVAESGIGTGQAKIAKLIKIPPC